MEKKTYITLFDNEGRMIDEKLIGQDSEFYKGPVLQHDGPFRLGITFLDKGDIDKAIKYILQLTGTLPLTSKILKKEIKTPSIPEHRKQLIGDALANSTDQDQLIKYLREHGFVFSTWDYLQTLEHVEILNMKEVHGPNFEWMVKRIKTAKNPKLDKYDLMVLFGISLMGERSDRVIIYLDGFHLKNVKVPVPEKPRETVKKTEMMKFPPAMITEERDRFRFELRQLQRDPTKEITKFFNRWRTFVDHVPAIPQDKKVTE